LQEASSELETVGTAARDFEERLRLRYCTVLIITICRRLSSELETVGTAARDFEERLRFQLETSLRTEEENDAKLREMTANLSALGKENVARICSNVG
jgi:DNA-directed RNA polymerase specialized sigma54-like protein